MGIKIFGKKRGFTLVETIVVVGVFAIALPALFSILFVVLRQQARVYRLVEIKKQGDAVLKQVEAKVRADAQTIYGCPISGGTCGGGTPFGYQCFQPNTRATISAFNFDGNGDPDWFAIIPTAQQNIQLIGSSGVSDLTSPDKTLVENFSFTCFKKDAYTAPSVTLHFDICYRVSKTSDSCESIRPEENAKLSYTATVQLRNPVQVYPTSSPSD